MEEQIVYLVLRAQKGCKPRVVGAYQSEEKRVEELNNYFNRMKISGIPIVKNNKVIKYMCPNNIVLKLQEIEIDKYIRNKNC